MKKATLFFVAVGMVTVTVGLTYYVTVANITPVPNTPAQITVDASPQASASVEANENTKAETGDDVIQQRMAVMKALQQSINSLNLILFNPVSPDHASSRQHLDQILDGLEQLPGLFPQGSVDDSSRAAPAIWDDWEAFVQLIDLSKSATKELASGLAGGNKSTVGAPGVGIPSNPLGAPQSSGLGRALQQVPAFPSGMPNSPQFNQGANGSVLQNQAMMTSQFAFLKLNRLCADCHTRFIKIDQSKAPTEATP